MGFLPAETISTNKLYMVPNADQYDFGVLISGMHMAWMRYVGGRLKADYQYSSLPYNTFPWPEDPSVAAKAAIEKAGQAILAVRTKFPASTLADLYDPITMPANLRKAHHTLDQLVDRAYRKQPFGSDTERMEFLLARYQTLITPLTSIVAAKPKKEKRARA